MIRHSFGGSVVDRERLTLQLLSFPARSENNEQRDQAEACDEEYDEGDEQRSHCRRKAIEGKIIAGEKLTAGCHCRIKLLEL